LLQLDTPEPTARSVSADRRDFFIER